jgi:hypothetical protein
VRESLCRRQVYGLEGLEVERMSARLVEVVAGEGGDCCRYEWRLPGEKPEQRWRIGEVMWKMTRKRTMAVEWVYFLRNLNLCHEAEVESEN